MINHNLDELKSLIQELEETNNYLHESIEVYDENDLPPHAKNILKEINLNKKRLSVLNRYLLNFPEKKPVGRPSVGKTKRVALTLPEELWDRIDEEKESKDLSLAALFREIIENYYSDEELVEIYYVEDKN